MGLYEGQACLQLSIVQPPTDFPGFEEDAEASRTEERWASCRKFRLGFVSFMRHSSHAAAFAWQCLRPMSVQARAMWS